MLLEENGFTSHQEWKAQWEEKRNSEFFVLGSKDETAGNQTCTAYSKEGKFCLRLRLPTALESKYGKYLIIDNVTFAYGHEAILASLNHPEGQAISYKDGVIVHQVNPAFTSIIGRINYAKRYGLSIHLAAALCIARRYQQFSEAPSSSEGIIPDGKGGHVAFVLPVRNRTKYVWHFWGRVKKKLGTVLAAHFQAMRNRSSSPPSSAPVIELPDRYWRNSNT